MQKHGGAREATDDNIIRSTNFDRWITKTTDTFKMCNNYCFSTATVITETCLNVTSYVHLLCYLLLLYFISHFTNTTQFELI
jgi:hypothetical protein